MIKLMYSLSLLVFLGSVPSLSSAKASDINCRDFAALSGVSTHEDYKKSKSTAEQFNLFRDVIADYAGRIVAHEPLSKRNNALQFVLKNEKMKSFVIGNAFEMTVDFCVDQKDVPMKNVAIEQFDYLLDAIEKKIGK
ncbi:hypothetical protein P7M77_16105 [Vibrio parahaemolyticus]|nr:hypothetical protein [Vibrio parahaemolyticus]MDG2731573.1 hypothetical protein [Vibrio parahaemolyticus]